MNNYQQRLVVLIDADNTSYTITEGLMSEIAKYGTAHVKRIYGDWTSPNLKNWKEILLKYALQPIQQFGYTKGKNSTDSAMIIDAMDLLYTGKFDGFCIVSSDSDFTRLAERIREGGLTVYGFGRKITPQSFIAVCDKFIYTEILNTITDQDNGTEQENTNKKSLITDTEINLLKSAVTASADDTGWAFLGSVGQHMTKQAPEFDSRNYGFNKLRDLVQSVDLFDIEERKDEKAPNIRQIYIKIQEKPKTAKKTTKAKTTRKQSGSRKKKINDSN